MDYFVSPVPGSDITVATIAKTPSGFGGHTPMFFPGLHEKPNEFYDWQHGSTRVVDYLFFNGQSIVSLIHDCQATNRIETVFLDSGINQGYGVYPGLKGSDGQPYHLLLLHNPRTLADILSALHEIAHIEVSEQQPDRQNQINTAGGFMSELDRLFSEYNKLVDLDVDESILRSQIREIAQTQAGQRYQGAKMVYEMEVWLHAFFTIGRMGLNELFKDADTLTDFIAWNIRSRMKFEEEPGIDLGPPHR